MNELRKLSSLKTVQGTNRATILRALYEKAPLTRVDLAQETKLSPPTVTRIVRELIRRKIVVEVGKVPSQQGRSPISLQLNLEKPFIIGLEISQRRLSGVISSLKGDVKTRFSHPLESTNVTDVSATISLLLSEAFATLKCEQDDILGIGVSISGLVSADQQSIIFSEAMNWRNVIVSDLFPSFVDNTILVENDANAAMLGECWLGRFRSYSNILFISVGIGVGASIRLNGQLVKGQYGIAGEIGHTLVVEDGLECSCGRRGCLEPYVTIDAVQRQYNETTSKNVDIVQAFLVNDPIATKVLSRAAMMLGRAISSCCLLINPEVVILGGLWVEAGNRFLTMVYSQTKASYPLDLAYLPRIHYASQHPYGGVMGAVSLVIDDFLEYPKYQNDRFM